MTGLGGGATSLFRAGAGANTLGDQNNPAVNGQAINAAGRPTGWYWIQTSLMSSAKPIYINNDDEGGGWMLVSYDYNTSGSNNGTPFPSFFSESTVPTSFNNKTIVTDVYELWYHNGSPNISGNMQMWNKNDSSGNSVPLLTNMTSASKVVWNAPQNFVNPTVTGTAGSQTATLQTPTPQKLTGSWTPVKQFTTIASEMSSAGVTNLTVDCPPDWLYNDGSSFYWHPCGPSSDVANNYGRSGNGHGTGCWINANGNDFWGGKDVSSTDSQQDTNNYSFAVYIK